MRRSTRPWGVSNVKSVGRCPVTPQKERERERKWRKLCGSHIELAVTVAAAISLVQEEMECSCDDVTHGRRHRWSKHSREEWVRTPPWCHWLTRLKPLREERTRENGVRVGPRKERVGVSGTREGGGIRARGYS